MNLDASTIKDGGVVVLCIFVMIELRGIRPVLSSIREVLSALLERDRIRGERKHPSEQRPKLRTPRGEFDHEESTDLHDIIDLQRRSQAKTPRGGVRPPRAGSHHDEG